MNQTWTVVRRAAVGKLLRPCSSENLISRILLLVLLFGNQSAGASAKYRLTDMGLLGDDWTGTGDDVNDSGIVVGSSITYTDAGGWSGVRWSSPDGLTDLTQLPDFQQSSANAINAQGQIVGSSWTYINNVGTFGHAYRWSPGVGMIDLGALPGTTVSTALDINSAGDVVGHSQYPQTSDGHAFLWTETGGMQDLGFMEGFDSAAALAINDSGAIVGQMTHATTHKAHGFVWTEAGGFTDLGTNSRAFDINEEGTVVGDQNGEAFVWTPAEGLVALAPPAGYEASSANAINDLGQIVGFVTLPFGQPRAAIWTKEQEFVDLNTLVDESAEGWVLDYANGINNRGQIVGTGIYKNSMGGIVLLTPVPEPTVWCGCGVALVVAAVVRRRVTG